MKWKKLGLLYNPLETINHPKLLTHAANPLATHMYDDVFRIFFSGRDEKNRSSVGAIDIDIVKRKIITQFDKPFFEHGPDGSFYQDGVSVGCCYSAGGNNYILFMGWQVNGLSHWRGDIGRLRLTNDYRLRLCPEKGLLLSLDSFDPVSLSYPWVMGNPNDGYIMWYGTTYTWNTGNGEMLHVLATAISTDGHHWVKNGLSVPFELGKVQAFSRPTVVAICDGGLEMWFSYRGKGGDSYRIGYAKSLDGKQWELDVERSGIDVSGTGWDSGMIEYPFVFDHKGQRYMLYNGNDYGRTGFGLAVLEIC